MLNIVCFAGSLWDAVYRQVPTGCFLLDGSFICANGQVCHTFPKKHVTLLGFYDFFLANSLATCLDSTYNTISVPLMQADFDSRKEKHQLRNSSTTSVGYFGILSTTG